jgi:crotonobetainyl-CoA:carnitine CoA-transferase CaiB-like acyl-CoA transferase
LTGHQVAALDMIITVDDAALGPMRMQNVLWRMGRTPGRIRSTGRRPGQDTDEVLAEAGLSDSEVAVLRESGVVR